MVIEVNNRGTLFVFADWVCGDPNFMWFRVLFTSQEKEEGNVGIALLKFDGLWAPRFFGKSLLGLFSKSYDIMYPNNKGYPSAEEGKEAVDKFLHRVSSLKLFL
jgi:hypothetical protein